MLEILSFRHSTRLSSDYCREIYDLGSPSSRELSLEFSKQMTARCSGVHIRLERFWSCRKLPEESEIRKFLPGIDWDKRHQVPCQERGIVTDTMAKGQRIVSYCIF